MPSVYIKMLWENVGDLWSAGDSLNTNQTYTRDRHQKNTIVKKPPFIRLGPLLDLEFNNQDAFLQDSSFFVFYTVDAHYRLRVRMVEDERAHACV